MRMALRPLCTVLPTNSRKCGERSFKDARAAALLQVARHDLHGRGTGDDVRRQAGDESAEDLPVEHDVVRLASVRFVRGAFAAPRRHASAVMGVGVGNRLLPRSAAQAEH